VAEDGFLCTQTYADYLRRLVSRFAGVFVFLRFVHLRAWPLA
jgi:hypothetical protein